jgi:peptidylprolyl isomerase
MSQTVENGKVISVNYVGTLDDGTEFDNSYTRGEPISFEVGGAGIIKGFSSAVTGMTVGEKKTVTIPCLEAYGERTLEAVQVFPRESFTEDMELHVGMQVTGANEEGQEFPAIVSAVASNGIVLDMNHPLAGQDLTFQVEIVSIDP